MNIKKSIAIIFVVVTIAATSVITFAQSYVQPTEVAIAGLVRQTFPKFYARGNRYPQLVPEGFFPIGWSEDGKFAYYSEPVDEACGCYFGYLAIQDLRTDKIVWEFRYDQSDEMEPATGKMLGPGNIRELWAKNEKLFSEKLAENGIIASRSVIIGKTFTAAGNSYSAKSVKKMGKNPDDDWARVDIFELAVSSPKLGSKSVYKADYSDQEYWFMLDAGLIGVIKSPYENRVALIAIEAMKGYEGPPHTGQIRVVGADLTSGFKK